MNVEQLTIDDIHDLRVRVLRKGTPVTHARYPEDNYNDVVHLGIRINGIVRATSTWFTKECPVVPGVRAVQLKGMAVDDSLQTTGYGRELIEAGIQVAHERHATLLWARARDSALGFYEKCEFAAVGNGFIDEPTAMPHHIVVRYV